MDFCKWLTNLSYISGALYNQSNGILLDQQCWTSQFYYQRVSLLLKLLEYSTCYSGIQTWWWLSDCLTYWGKKSYKVAKLRDMNLSRISNSPIRWVPWALSPEKRNQSVKLITHFNLVPQLKMYGDMPPLPYTTLCYKLWCLSTYKQFYLTFYLYLKY